MLRRVACFSFILSFVVLSAPGQILAASKPMPKPTNSITFTSVSFFLPQNGCTPTINDEIQINARISVAPDTINRKDTWTISNPMGMGMSMATGTVDGGKTGQVFNGFMTMPVPDGTMMGDNLTIMVQMAYQLHGKSFNQTVSAAFNCWTGQFVTSSSMGMGMGMLPALQFTDGRLNQQPEQAVAVYPTDKGGYDLYVIKQGIGSLALHITKDQLTANPDKGHNYLIAENMGVQLYRLAGGMLQVQSNKPDGKMYVYTWQG